MSRNYERVLYFLAGIGAAGLAYLFDTI